MLNVRRYGSERHKSSCWNKKFPPQINLIFKGEITLKSHKYTTSVTKCTFFILTSFVQANMCVMKI